MEGILALVLSIIVGFVGLLIWLAVKAVSLSSATSRLRLPLELLERDLHGLRVRLASTEAAPSEVSPTTAQPEITPQELRSPLSHEEPSAAPAIPALAPVTAPAESRDPVLEAPPLIEPS